VTVTESPRAAQSRQRILAVAGGARRNRGPGDSRGLPARRFQSRTAVPIFDSRSALLVAVVEQFYLRLCHAAAGREYSQPTWAILDVSAAQANIGAEFDSRQLHQMRQARTILACSLCVRRGHCGSAMTGS
jgi:hypothetical protein